MTLGLLAVMLAFTPSVSRGGTVKIMPLGDSITQGYRGRDSYRRDLWLKLKETGADVDFVGSMKNNFMGAPAHEDFDMDHEGHWGWRADQILEKIDSWAARFKPDIVLMHLGTNDIGSQQDITETVTELKKTIAILRKHNPGVTILLAQILPVAFTYANIRIMTFNDALPELAKSLNSEKSPIIIVNHFNGFDATRDTYDGIHPNESGIKKMVVKWAAALNKVFVNTGISKNIEQ
jgi:lysophospholipase L1-like esterase